jgi:lipopolysaccharide transport system permease protein
MPQVPDSIVGIYVAGLKELFATFVALLQRYHQLIFELTRREILDRHVGQVLGPAWTIGYPLLLMALYVFIFTVVFPTRFPVDVVMPRSYVVYILAGLVPWLGFADAMNKNCRTILINASLVKQVAFPVEILPIKVTLAAFAAQLIATILLVGYAGILDPAGLSATIVLLPFLLLLQVIAMLGVAYAFSAVSVFFRDLSEVVQLFTTAGLFLAPILYLPQWIEQTWPPLFWLMHFNPFSHVVWCYQDVIYFGRFEHPVSWLIFIALALGAFGAGFGLFRKLRPLFGETL